MSESRSRSQSSQESIYFNTHFSDTIMLNVTNAHIVDSSDLLVEEDGDEEIPETRNIRLPNQILSINHLSIDIGGSLLKLIYFTKDEHQHLPNGGRFNFVKIETEEIDKFIKKIQEVLKKYYNHDPDINDFNHTVTIMATGGGAFKYFERLQLELKCKVVKVDEMQSLIVGLDFFIKEIPNEIFTTNNSQPIHFYNEDNSLITNDDSIYPYLLVNIGSGVSMIKVTGSGPNNFTRVGGSSLGGGTLWGLLSILTTLDDFDEMLNLALQGDNENVDLLVGDIYGQGYNKIGLKSNHIASSFGKVFKKVQSDCNDNFDEKYSFLDSNTRQRLQRMMKFEESDIARSLLFAISNNIGQISYLQAQRYNLKKIYFAGSYIRGHPQTIHTLSYAINFWSNGEKKLYFIRHEGYLGSMGAFLQMKRDD